MAERNRNAKARAQRIEREYFKRVFAIPKWCRQLTFILAGVGVGWLGWMVIARDETVYSSGPVTAHHASFGKNCRACHVLRTAMRSNVADRACLICHDGPAHQEEQVAAPHCVDCHVEHRGVEQLFGAGSKACTSCHSDLKTRSGLVMVATHIKSFAEGHPEFTSLRPGHADPGGIKFNHKIHLRRDLKTPGGTVQLECNDCHRPAGIDQPWPYGSPTPMEPASRVNLAPLQPHVSARAYMQPIRYYEHCSSCHPLLSDPRIGEPVPHKKPEIVISFLESHLRRYVAGHPEELRAEPPEARITRERSPQPPRRATEWVRTGLEESERLLWSKTCAECHTLDGVGVVSAPRIREARLTARWLERGDFDHASHKMLACAGCHTAVTSSERTSDVLIPRIRICRSCHDAGSSSPPARADCYECHRYHDWSKEKPRHGNLGPPVS